MSATLQELLKAPLVTPVMVREVFVQSPGTWLEIAVLHAIAEGRCSSPEKCARIALGLEP